MDTFMITFFILLGVAVALGGVILYLVLHGKGNADGEVATEIKEDAAKAEEEPVTEEEPKVEEKPEEAEPEVAAVEEEVPEEVEEEPEPVEEPVVEEVPEPVEEPKPAAAKIIPIVVPADTEEEDDGEDEKEEHTERKLVVEGGEVKYIIIKYSKSFQAKIIQSSDVTKNYYSELKNCLLSYKGVKSRMSWRWETYRSGRKTLAKLRMRGKTLSIALALNPDDYTDTKYVVESLAEVAAYEDTQCLYKIKNDRRLKYAKELIDKVMMDNGLSAGLIAENTDYASLYPYEETEPLIERKLIKVLTDEDAQSGTVFRPSDVRQSVTAAEVDSIMQDEVAEVLIEKSEEQEVTDRTKVGIVNIDALSRAFADGETVTLEEIKKRVKGFDKKITYVKVLARGVLDKKLTVKADAFSIQAVKMILLTGGKVIKK